MKNRYFFIAGCLIGLSIALVSKADQKPARGLTTILKPLTRMRGKTFVVGVVTAYTASWLSAHRWATSAEFDSWMAATHKQLSSSFGKLRSAARGDFQELGLTVDRTTQELEKTSAAINQSLINQKHDFDQFRRQLHKAQLQESTKKDQPFFTFLHTKSPKKI